MANIKVCCETCEYFLEDPSVNAFDCENCDEDWTDEEIEKYFENSEDGCPHWKQAEIPPFWEENEQEGGEEGNG